MGRVRQNIELFNEELSGGSDMRVAGSSKFVLVIEFCGKFIKVHENEAKRNEILC